MVVASITVDADQISRWFAPFGTVDKNTSLRIANRTAPLARRLAPKRSGALSRSIHVVQARGARGRFTSAWAVRAEAPHGIYVLKGTSGNQFGMIRPKPTNWPNGKARYLGKWPGGIPGIGWRSYVRGQSANNFLGEALRAAMEGLAPNVL